MTTLPKFEKGDFSSKGYPFDDGPVYLGINSTPDASRQSTSLKYAPYILVNCSDVLLQQYVLFDSLVQRRDDQAFRDRLLEGLQELFRTIAGRVDTICQAKRMVITDVALTIPAQWSLEFEDLYANIVAPLFGLERSNIYFCTETEALANCLLRCHANELANLGEFKTLIFLDFGGHNMNGCVFEVVSGQNGISFFRASEPFGAGGGSEQWEDNIARMCSPHIQAAHDLDMTPRRRQLLQDLFSPFKVEAGPGLSEEDVVFFLREGGGRRWEIVIPKGTVDQAWEDAHRHVLSVAGERINQFAGKPGVRVVLSGGTGRHQTLQDRVSKLCQDAGLEMPILTDGLEGAYDTVKVAKGAALAVGQRATEQQFFERGGSIGLQLKQGGDANPDGLWDDTATFLAGMNLRQDVQIDIISPDDELRLVCDPYRSAADGMNDMDHDRCYDFLAIGKLAVGEYRFSCYIQGTGDNVDLQLKRYRKRTMRRRMSLTGKKPRGGPPQFWRLEKTIRLPVYFDPGANCLHIGVRGRDIRDVNIPGIPPTTFPQTTTISNAQVEAPSQEAGTASEEAITQAAGSGDASMSNTTSQRESSGAGPSRPRSAKPARPTLRIDPFAGGGSRSGSGSGSGLGSGAMSGSGSGSGSALT